MPSYTLTLPDFIPVSVNALMRRVRGRSRQKRGDREVVAHYAREQGIPRATGKRRCSYVFTQNKGKLIDPGNHLKSIEDALVSCKLLLQDSGDVYEIGSVVVRRGDRRQTEVLIEDLE